MGEVKGYVYNNILALHKIELNKAKEAFFAKKTEHKQSYMITK